MRSEIVYSPFTSNIAMTYKIAYLILWNAGARSCLAERGFIAARPLIT